MGANRIGTGLAALALLGGCGMAQTASGLASPGAAQSAYQTQSGVPGSSTPTARTSTPTRAPVPTITPALSIGPITPAASNTAINPIPSVLDGSGEWTSTNDGNPVFDRCSTVTWVYDASQAPENASTANVVADIYGALGIIGAQTGLTFVQGTNMQLEGKPNVIIYRWDTTLGKDVGQGSYQITTAGERKWATGVVRINNDHWWTNDDYQGFTMVAGPSGVATGRGWLFVHETMHVLGLGHFDSEGEIMNPVIPDLTSLGPGDLTGLRTLYRPWSC